MPDPTFPHNRLEVYRLSLQLAVICDRIAKSLPRGYAKIADDLKRASHGIPLLIGEGANRYTAGQKRQRFGEARGECGECAVALELTNALGLSHDDAPEGLVLCSRIAAMLTKLIQRFQ